MEQKRVIVVDFKEAAFSRMDNHLLEIAQTFVARLCIHVRVSGAALPVIFIVVVSYPGSAYRCHHAGRGQLVFHGSALKHVPLI